MSSTVPITSPKEDTPAFLQMCNTALLKSSFESKEPNYFLPLLQERRDSEKIGEHKRIVSDSAFEYVMSSLGVDGKYDSFLDCIIHETEMRPTIPSYIVSCFEANARGVSDSQNGMEQLMYVGYHCAKDIDPGYFRDTVKALLEINQFEKSHGDEIRTMTASFERLMGMSENERNSRADFMEYLAEGTSAEM